MVDTPPSAGTPTGTPNGETNQPQGGQPPAGNTTQAQGAGNAGTGQQSQNPPVSKPTAPEKYDLKLPENGMLDQGHLDKIADYAKSRGLSQEDAQKMVERENQVLADYADNQMNKVQAERDSWVEQLQSDKELGGENLPKVAELAKRAVDRFASAEFKKALEDTGFGNHPEVVRVFYKIGKMMANDTTVLGGVAPQAKREAKDVLYGNPQGTNG